ncbi:Metallopeptidase OS=Tsukamurella paurometabola (strain ATCC 8368 / DSM / CCUG 35730 / CIP 100753/ JCM 10117 / KCTC 9821 / NBRC 16120 / NCIMB 702349 / NCTC 13040) OX=521096 GN=Tpau_0282 PE=4 SV=1 [Tsukamurella paurometabola]|uniref:Metallopeptidase n=1 Tax=Tsukamurella paurometabola (strain ATCC 8368 / DSM 20162 / CCUG 35730 / CIP 100753 / JCM 10117 / KCTC 9821 / NBRC 16120 / NCIMB 702349 / NCTC 13040) TaxID=521096 RepID=D5UQU7_TSUPD|nr:MepB family protein [Tsukamurella paurometabola]ADG76930.1 protein of unknown function UCP032285 [Tsukamurella paurometabola DSM 20162]SUP42250.1 MepB protein [Tsukamurella paurometabola]
MGFSAFRVWASKFGLTVSVEPEAQNSDYESGVAQIAGREWHVRTARNTPTKPGAFVAFWRRGMDGQTLPFSVERLDAGLLVFVESEGRRGVFKFSASHLAELGIASASDRGGKRGFRVYPSWCEGLNPQARATQRAQAPAFDEY